MNLHLIRDNSISQYFVETINRLNLRGNNWIVCYHSSDQTRFVKEYDLFVNLKKQNIRNLLPNIESYDEIFIHLLDTRLYKWLAEDSRITNFNWSVWGADIYNVPFLEFGLFLPETYKFVNRYQRERLRRIYYNTFYRKNFYKASKKVKRVLTWNSDSYNRIQSLTDHNIDFCEFIYGQMINPEKEASPARGQKRTSDQLNVMVGHSAVAVANQLDFLKSVESKVDRNKFKFYLPISYGHKNYRKFLKKEALKLDLDIKFIEDFLPMNEYKKFLNSIDYLVVNSLRPLALGNVFLAILNHIPVLIPDENPIKKILSEFSVTTLSLSSFATDLEEATNKLDLPASEENLRRYFSADFVDERYLKVFG